MPGKQFLTFDVGYDLRVTQVSKPSIWAKYDSRKGYWTDNIGVNRPRCAVRIRERYFSSIGVESRARALLVTERFFTAHTDRIDLPTRVSLYS